MPRESTDRRRSSIGSRRGPPKKHIPFRADDLRLGKKTGIAVQYVGRDSDEFEPFDELMKQADDRTPPRVKSRKGRISVLPEYDEYDENGEMSMELAESECTARDSDPMSSILIVSCRQPGQSAPVLYKRAKYSA